MDDLLKLEVEAHGGIGRWRQLKVVRAGASITGALWSLKGRPDVLKDIPDWLHYVIKHPVADGQFVAVGWASLAVWLRESPRTQGVISIAGQKGTPL